MGFLDKFLPGVQGVAKVAGTATDIVSGAAHLFGLTRAEKQQNEFNAQQAQASRDWEEQQYLKHGTMQAKVEEANAAGINPAAIFGDLNNASAPSSGATASAGSLLQDTSTNIMPRIQQIEQQQANIDLTKSQKNYYDKLANKTGNEAESIAIDLKTKEGMNEAKLRGQELENILKEKNISKTEVETAKAMQEIFYIEENTKYLATMQNCEKMRVELEKQLTESEVKENEANVQQIKRRIEFYDTEEKLAFSQAVKNYADSESNRMVAEASVENAGTNRGRLVLDEKELGYKIPQYQSNVELQEAMIKNYDNMRRNRTAGTIINGFGTVANSVGQFIGRGSGAGGFMSNGYYMNWAQ